MSETQASIDRRGVEGDLDQAMYEVLLGTLTYLKKKNTGIDPATRQAFEYFQEKCGRENPNSSKKEDVTFA